MIKQVLIWCLVLSSVTMMAQKKDKLDWHTDLVEVKATSKKTGKPILMLFTGSDWCPPCKMLKRDFFDSDQFKKVADKFVLLYVDSPRNKSIITAEQLKANNALMDKYRIESIPTVIVADAEGNILDDIEGYSRGGKRHFKFIEKVLSK